jgi:hypothetical protein
MYHSHIKLQPSIAESDEISRRDESSRSPAILASNLPVDVLAKEFDTFDPFG